MEITRDIFNDLDAYEMRLYVYYKLEAQNGEVEQPLRQTAKGAGLSVTKVMKVRKTLQEKGYLVNKPRIVTSGAVIVK